MAACFVAVDFHLLVVMKFTRLRCCCKFIFVFSTLMKGISFYPRDVVSGVLATATGLAGWLAGWVGVRHTPVLYQNGYH